MRPNAVKDTKDTPIASDKGVPGVQKARGHSQGDGVDEGVGGGDDDDDDDDSDWRVRGGPELVSWPLLLRSSIPCPRMAFLVLKFSFD